MSLHEKLLEERARLANILLSLTYYDNVEGLSLNDQLRQHAHLKGQFDVVTGLLNEFFPTAEQLANPTPEGE